jgi:hypothetical protein
MKRTAEDWAKLKNTPDWMMAAVRTRQRWGIGKEVDEADFDAAVTGVLAIKIGYAPPAPSPSKEDAPRQTAAELEREVEQAGSMSSAPNTDEGDSPPPAFPAEPSEESTDRHL